MKKHTKLILCIIFSVSVLTGIINGSNNIYTFNKQNSENDIQSGLRDAGDWDPQITKSVGDRPPSVFIGDTNNDGFNDIATANYYDDTVSILLWNNISGEWNPQITKSVGIHPGSIFIGDANNDGYNDIAAANGIDNTVSILLWSISTVSEELPIPLIITISALSAGAVIGVAGIFWYRRRKREL